MAAKSVVWRDNANRDVTDAVTYLTLNAEDAADGFIEALREAIAHSGRRPGMGSPRYGDELDIPGLRSWPVARFPYLIFYVERTDFIDVWRVLHTRRDLPSLVQPPGES